MDGEIDEEWMGVSERLRALFFMLMENTGRGDVISGTADLFFIGSAV